MLGSNSGAPAPVGRRARRPGNRAGQTPANLGDRLLGARVGRREAICAPGASGSAGFPILVGVDVGQHGHRVLEMVEGDDRIGEHEREVGHAERVGVGIAQGLDGAHEVVGEHPDGASGERRQARQRGGPVAAEFLGGQRVGVARIPE